MCGRAFPDTIAYTHDESEHFLHESHLRGARPGRRPRRRPRARGHHRPFPIQALTIPDALAGRDICGKAKTGSGKTLAFGLPLLERVGKARAGRARGRWCSSPPASSPTQVSAVLGPLGKSRDRRVIAPCTAVSSWSRRSPRSSKGVDVVVGTPGRLIDLIERRELSFAAVEVLVVDEADRMADMGFMPQVQKILYRIESDASDDAVLRDARRRGQAPRRPLHARP